MMFGLFPVCREVTGMLAEGNLETAPWYTRVLIRMHLAMCEHCRRFARQLELIGNALCELWSRKPTPERLDATKRRIMARLGTRGN